MIFNNIRPLDHKMTKDTQSSTILSSTISTAGAGGFSLSREFCGRSGGVSLLNDTGEPPFPILWTGKGQFSPAGFFVCRFEVYVAPVLLCLGISAIIICCVIASHA